jgi:hypothetical protein
MLPLVSRVYPLSFRRIVCVHPLPRPDQALLYLTTLPGSQVIDGRSLYKHFNPIAYSGQEWPEPPGSSVQLLSVASCGSSDVCFLLVC